MLLMAQEQTQEEAAGAAAPQGTEQQAAVEQVRTRAGMGRPWLGG